MTVVARNLTGAKAERGIIVSLIGEQRLKAQFGVIDRRARQIGRDDTAGDVLLAEVMSRAPVRTGRLKSRTRRTAASIRTLTPYATAVHWGHKGVYSPLFLWGRRQPAGAVVKEPNMYIWDAFHTDRVNDAYEDALQRIIRTSGGGVI